MIRRPGALFGRRKGFRGVGGGTAFSPLSFAPDGWWRADLGVTLVSGAVSVWADQSGNGNDWAQTTEAIRPIYNTTDANFNGRATIAATTAGDHRMDAGDVLDIPDTSDRTMLAVSKQGDAVNQCHLINKLGAAAGFLWRTNAGAYSWRVDDTDTSTADASETPTDADDDAVHAYMCEYDDSAGLATNYLDGVSVATATDVGLTGASKAAGANMFLFNRGSGGRTWDGELAELVILDRLLTAAEKVLWHNYINARYGLSI